MIMLRCPTSSGSLIPAGVSLSSPWRRVRVHTEAEIEKQMVEFMSVRDDRDKSPPSNPRLLSNHHNYQIFYDQHFQHGSETEVRICKGSDGTVHDESNGDKVQFLRESG